MGQVNSLNSLSSPSHTIIFRPTAIRNPDELKPMYNQLITSLAEMRSSNYSDPYRILPFVSNIIYYNASYDTIKNRIVTEYSDGYPDDWVFDANMYPPKIPVPLELHEMIDNGWNIQPPELSCNPNETLPPDTTEAPIYIPPTSDGTPIFTGCAIM